MAYVKSTQITNLDAGTREPGHRRDAMMREACSTVATSASESASNDIMFVVVPSNARVSQVLISCADATTGGAIDVGIWARTLVDGAAVYTAVDDDLFASALDLSGGPMKNLDITYESDEYGVDESEKELWEVLGLSVDPNLDYIVASDITTVFNGGPTTINLKVRYSI